MSQRPKSFDDAIDALEKFSPGTRDKFADEIDRLGTLFSEFKPTAEHLDRARESATREIKRRPWLTLGLVGLLGLALGFFLGRKGQR